MSVFLYGRGTENRTLIYRLKAGYFTIKLYPQKFGTFVTFHDVFLCMVATDSFEMSTPALSRRCSSSELRGYKITALFGMLVIKQTTHRLAAICLFGNLLYYSRFLHISVIARNLSSPRPPSLVAGCLECPAGSRCL